MPVGWPGGSGGGAGAGAGAGVVSGATGLPSVPVPQPAAAISRAEVRPGGPAHHPSFGKMQRSRSMSAHFAA